MNRRDVQQAWQYIFDAAESVLEDDLNEDGEMSDQEFDDRLKLAFDIIENPHIYKDAL